MPNRLHNSFSWVKIHSFWYPISIKWKFRFFVCRKNWNFPTVKNGHVGLRIFCLLIFFNWHKNITNLLYWKHCACFLPGKDYIHIFGIFCPLLPVSFCIFAHRRKCAGYFHVIIVSSLPNLLIVIILSGIKIKIQLTNMAAGLFYIVLNNSFSLQVSCGIKVENIEHPVKHTHTHFLTLH